MLRRLRTEQARTIEDVARAANLSGPYLSRLENNQVPTPPVATLRDLARALDVSIDSLTQGADEVPPSIARAVAESPDAFFVLADMTPRQRAKFVADHRTKRPANPDRLSAAEIAKLKRELLE